MTYRTLATEALATAFLLMAVVGSGIMGERLSGGNVGIALIANSMATGAALVALILTFGAHMNPLVSGAAAIDGTLSWSDAMARTGAQVIGAFAGVAVADLMFGVPMFAAARHIRAGWPLALSETVASFGLLMVVSNASRRTPEAVSFAVGAYITAAYWFTSSTSFANPAVTLARSVTDTFTGIRPVDTPVFLAAQLLGAALAVAWNRSLAHE